MRALCILFVLLCAAPNFAGDFKWERLGQRRRGGLPEKFVAGRNFRLLVRSMVNTNQVEKLEAYFRELKTDVDLKQSLNQFYENELPLLHDALHVAYVSYDVIEVLLMHGADPNVAIARNFKLGRRNGYLLYKGYNAAHVAVRMRKPMPILELLKEYEADFLQPDDGGDDGWTPVQLAYKTKNLAAIEFIEKNHDLLPTSAELIPANNERANDVGGEDAESNTSPDDAECTNVNEHVAYEDLHVHATEPWSIPVQQEVHDAHAAFLEGKPSMCGLTSTFALAGFVALCYCLSFV